MANYEATKYNFDGSDLTGIQGVNTGLIVPWSDTTVPSGFLECNGAAVSRSTYSGLFAVVGTTYGSGNGSTTFTLPDLQDKVAMGRSPGKALASTGGANTVASTGNVSVTAANHTLTTPELPTHNHFPGNLTIGANYVQAVSNATNPAIINQATSIQFGSTGGDGAHSHAAGGTYTGVANSVLQPYLTIKYIIKT
tara:strand:+ start:2835 stop:3419 length:585 start_codon:yes stop_codon:yes gene_type:complete